MSRTYAKFPEVESERTTQNKPRQHYGMVVIVEIQKIIFQTSLLITFILIPKKYRELKPADVLTPVSSTPLVYS